MSYPFSYKIGWACLACLTLILQFGGCNRCASNAELSTAEDYSNVVFIPEKLFQEIHVRVLDVQRVEGDRLQVTAHLYLRESQYPYGVYIKTDFYSPKFHAGGLIVDESKWTFYELEPGKSNQYVALSVKRADDFRLYISNMKP